MLARLLLLFIAVPLIELWLLLLLAERISWQWTFALVLLTGVAGAWLARQQGFRAVQQAMRDLNEGRLPTDALQDGILILLAGALLITPGLLTDVVGFSLLVPPCRRALRRWLAARLRTRMHVETFGAFGSGGPFDTAWGRAGRGERPIDVPSAPVDENAADDDTAGDTAADTAADSVADSVADSGAIDASRAADPRGRIIDVRIIPPDDGASPPTAGRRPGDDVPGRPPPQ